MSTTVRVGGVDPEGIRLTIAAPDGVDMTEATAVELDVVRRDGTSDTWVATIDAGATTSTSLVASYVFEAGDLSTVGTYRLRPRITFGAVVRRALSVLLHVTKD